MKKAVLTVVLTLVLVGGIIAAIGYSGGGSGGTGDAASTTTSSTALTKAQQAERDESAAWDNEATKAFGGEPLATAVHDMIQGVDQWKAGTKPTDQLAGELQKHLATFAAARDAVAQLRVYPRDPDPAHPLVTRIYLRSAEMYVETARLYQVMLTLPAGPLRDQQELLAKRVRELADRLFDRGRAFVVPHLFEDKVENVQVNLPEEVPNWAAEGEAPGPPVDDAPPAADRFPPVHADQRPTQPRATWVAAVRTAAIPPAAELAGAITAGDAGRLQALGRAYVAAAEKLRPLADPDSTGGREESARVRIGLLIDADAARAAQLGALVPGGRDQLGATARRLALIGDELWLPELPPRAAGFDPGLLTS